MTQVKTVTIRENTQSKLPQLASKLNDVVCVVSYIFIHVDKFVLILAAYQYSDKSCQMIPFSGKMTN